MENKLDELEKFLDGQIPKLKQSLKQRNAMKQIKVFGDVTGDMEKEVNAFLQNMQLHDVTIQSHWNNILGGVVFVVVYDVKKDS